MEAADLVGPQRNDVVNDVLDPGVAGKSAGSKVHLSNLGLLVLS
jgi:hypothetical protein